MGTTKEGDPRGYRGLILGLALMISGMAGIVLLKPGAGPMNRYLLSFKSVAVAPPSSFQQVPHLVKGWVKKSHLLRGSIQRTDDKEADAEMKEEEPPVVLAPSTLDGMDSEGVPSEVFQVLYEDAAKQKNAIKNYYGKMKEDQKRELERAGIKPRQIQDMMGEIASKEVEEKVKMEEQLASDHKNVVTDLLQHKGPVSDMEKDVKAQLMTRRRIAAMADSSTSSNDVTSTLGSEPGLTTREVVSGRIVNSSSSAFVFGHHRTFEDFQTRFRAQLYNPGLGGPDRQSMFEKINYAVAKSKQDMNLLPEVIRRPFETAVEVERQTMLEELNSRRLHKFESLWTDGTPEGEILEIARDLWDDEFDMMYEFEVEHMQERMELKSFVQHQALTLCEPGASDDGAIHKMEELYHKVISRQRKAMKERLELTKEQALTEKRRRMATNGELRETEAGLRLNADNTLGSFDAFNQDNKASVVDILKSELLHFC